VLWEALIEALQFCNIAGEFPQQEIVETLLSFEDTACSLDKLPQVIGGMLNFLMKVVIADAIAVSAVNDVRRPCHQRR
jgi:hypothetical protein